MKICFVLTGYSIVPTGGHKVIYEYANRLSENNEVALLFLNEGFYEKKYIPDFLRKIIIDYNTNKEPRWFNISKNVKKISAYGKKNIEDELKDYVLVATAVETAKITKELCKGKKGYYFIQDFENWNCDDEDVYETYKLGLVPITISTWLKQIVDQYSTTPSFLLPNPIDEKLYRTVIPIEDRKRHTIGLLYHESKHKGVKIALEVIHRIKELYGDLEVYMFGTANEPKELPEWIHYTKNATVEQTIQIYNTVTVFLCASIEEGFGLTGLEAMTCGCVLVSTAYKGVLEYAVNDENALLSPVNDIEALVKNVRIIFDDDKRMKGLVENAKNSIKSRSWEEQTKKIIEIFGKNENN